MHDRTPLRRRVDEGENNSGTILEYREETKGIPEPAALPAAALPALRAPGCVYIESESWPAGAPAYCNAPTAPRSPYCPKHLALCRVDPKSGAGRRLIRAQRRLARATASEVALPLPEPLDHSFDPLECDLAPKPSRATEEK